MTRQEANRKIVEKISAMVEKHPDLRFNQLLQNMNIDSPDEDRWYIESACLLDHLETDF